MIHYIFFNFTIWPTIPNHEFFLYNDFVTKIFLKLIYIYILMLHINLLDMIGKLILYVYVKIRFQIFVSPFGDADLSP